MKLAILAWFALSQEFFTATKTPEEMADRQPVFETSRGEFIIEFLPEKAPNHVGYIMKLIEEGAYNGTAFHRLIKYGIVQGGDPKTKDVDAVAEYGTGGLGFLKRELSDALHIRGALSAVQVPGDPDSAGSQFFIVVTDQPALDGQYTVFARVVEGINLIQTISETPTDENGLPTERIEITNVTLRDRPPPEIPPFSTETVEELATYRAVLETSFGEITMELFPHLAPNHVRNFLRLAKIGLYDGVRFHRVVPGFVIQTGFVETRAEPPSERLMKYFGNLEPEFNDTSHVAGIVSMAHGEDPASANSSFFIVTGPASPLDNLYTVFGRIVEGMSVVQQIEAVPAENEAPLERVELTKVRIEQIDEH